MRDKAVLFGASSMLERELDTIAAHYDIVGVVDNDPGKAGCRIGRLVVSGPQLLDQGDFDCVVITSSAFGSISQQLAGRAVSVRCPPFLTGSLREVCSKAPWFSDLECAGQTLFWKSIGLVPGKLPISEYNRSYLATKLQHLLLVIRRYVEILAHLELGRERPRQELAFLDHGGGSGLLAALAAEFGYGKVYYNDVYRTSCTDAEVICGALGVSIAAFIHGDIDDLIRYSKATGQRFDAIGSYDVVEHVYDLEGVLKALPAVLGRDARGAFMTTANHHNPEIGRELRMSQLTFEYLGRVPKPGDKEKDTCKAYLDERRSIVESVSRELGYALSNEETGMLALMTRGKRYDDIRRSVESYVDTRQLPALDILHPTNTCDPWTGNWAEHLLDFPIIEKAMAGAFWGKGCIYPTYECLPGATHVTFLGGACH